MKVIGWVKKAIFDHNTIKGLIKAILDYGSGNNSSVLALQPVTSFVT